MGGPDVGDPVTSARVTRLEEAEEAVSDADGLASVALGIEIGGTKLQSAVVAADGRVLLRRSDRVDPAGGAEGIRTVLAAQLAGIVDDAAGNCLAIRAIGIGFGGPVNRDLGVVATSFHVGGWSDFPLAAWVAGQVRDSLGGVPVVLENDSNAATLGEALVGAGRGARVVVYSNAGSGIGSGLVIDGRLFRGRSSGEMELGHLRLVPGGGILEDVSAGWAIDRKVREAVAADPALLRTVVSGGDDYEVLCTVAPSAVAGLKAAAANAGMALTAIGVVRGGPVSLAIELNGTPFAVGAGAYSHL